jgi:hypothetical protein
MGGDQKRSILDNIAEKRKAAEAMMLKDESEDAAYDMEVADFEECE